VAAWRGSSGISNEERNRLKNLIAKAKKSIVVSLGSPYVLRYFKDADVLIAAYDPTLQAQELSLIVCAERVHLQEDYPCTYLRWHHKVRSFTLCPGLYQSEDSLRPADGFCIRSSPRTSCEHAAGLDGG